MHTLCTSFGNHIMNNVARGGAFCSPATPRCIVMPTHTHCQTILNKKKKVLIGNAMKAPFWRYTFGGSSKTLRCLFAIVRNSADVLCGLHRSVANPATGVLCPSPNCSTVPNGVHHLPLLNCCHGTVPSKCQGCMLCDPNLQQ